jgi:hypothetical protein
MEHHRQKADIEQRDVSEEPGRIVLPRRQQQRRQEAAQQTEHRDDDGVQPDREREGRRGDQHHQDQGRDRAEERKLVDGAAGKGHPVEADNARGAKRVGDDLEVLARKANSSNDQPDPNEETDRDAHFRGHEIMVEAVFDEERDSEEQRQTADPCKELHAHELLKIEGRLGWLCANRHRTNRRSSGNPSGRSGGWNWFRSAGKGRRHDFLDPFGRPGQRRGDRHCFTENRFGRRGDRGSLVSSRFQTLEPLPKPKEFVADQIVVGREIAQFRTQPDERDENSQRDSHQHQDQEYNHSIHEPPFIRSRCFLLRS